MILCTSAAVFMHTVVPSCFAYLHHMFNMWHGCFFWIHSSVDRCFPLTSKEVSDRLTKKDWLLIQKQHFSTFSSNLDMIHEDHILMEAPDGGSCGGKWSQRTLFFTLEAFLWKEKLKRRKTWDMRKWHSGFSLWMCPKLFMCWSFIDSHRCKVTRRHISLQIPDRHTRMCIDCTQG